MTRGEKMNRYIDQTDEELIIEQMGKSLWKFISILSGNKKDSGKIRHGNENLLPDHFVVLGGGEFEFSTFDKILGKVMDRVSAGNGKRFLDFFLPGFLVLCVH